MQRVSGRRCGLSLCLAALALFGCGKKQNAGTAGGTSGGNNGAAADAALVRAMGDSAQWASYGRDQTNERYSPLTQVNTGTVKQLKLAWMYHTGVKRVFENSPLVVGNTMYVSTALDHVLALNATTGQKKWEYDYRLTGPTVHCCGAANRGLAYYDGKVFMGTLDAHLVALDTAGGHQVWDSQVDDPKAGYSITMPVVAAAGKVIVGVSGGEYGIRGHIDAYDTGSGKQVWRFYTIPSPSEMPHGWWGEWSNTNAFGVTVHKDRTQEHRDSARYANAWQTGGGAVWQAPAIDRQLGLVIFSVGNPSPDLDGSVRPGDDLFTDAIVAVDLNTGKYKWHMQEVPHDLWDVDATSPVVLADLRDASGATVPVAAEAGKIGWVFIVDRRTGKPVRLSQNYVPQKNIFAPPTPQGTFMIPGANGGSEWSAPAYSPQTGQLYILAMHQPMLYKVTQQPQPVTRPAMWLEGAFYGVTPQAGIFSAVDLNTGKLAWTKAFPDPMIGGALATAGGLVFTGTKDQRFLAMDARDGNVLWTYKADAGVNAPPITYEEGGRQYVAVAAGGNFQINAPRGDEVLVFTLGQGGGAAPSTSAMRAPARNGAMSMAVAGRQGKEAQ